MFLYKINWFFLHNTLYQQWMCLCRDLILNYLVYQIAFHSISYGKRNISGIHFLLEAFVISVLINWNGIVEVNKLFESIRM